MGVDVHVPKNMQRQRVFQMEADMGVAAALRLGGRDVPENGHGSFQHGEIQHVEIFQADFLHQWDVFLPIFYPGKLNI